LRANSSSSMFLLTCDWWLSTGDPNVIRNVLPVMFAVFCAMTPWPNMAQEDPPLITWRGRPFIKRVDMITANFAITDPEKNRGIRGWSCVWSCEVESYLKTTDLVDASQMGV
jgi:hypothetical protein